MPLSKAPQVAPDRLYMLHVICRHYVIVSSWFHRQKNWFHIRKKCYAFVYVGGVDVQLAFGVPDYVDSSCCVPKPLCIVHHTDNCLRNVKHFNGLRSGVDDVFHFT